MLIFVLVFGVLVGTVIADHSDKPAQEHHRPCEELHNHGCN
jgi:hypothetical protein